VRHATVSDPSLWLKCDFLVEFNDGFLPAVDGDLRRRLTRRGDALFPPERLSTWTDADGDAPTDEIREILERPFRPQTDEVIRGELWYGVLEEYPRWRQLIEASGTTARQHLRTLRELTELPKQSARRARQTLEARLAVLRARSLRLPLPSERRAAEDEVRREEAIGEAMIQGVEDPAISLVACGAVMLWPR
jgi:ATP-dependent helicase HepA